MTEEDLEKYFMDGMPARKPFLEKFFEGVDEVIKNPASYNQLNERLVIGKAVFWLYYIETLKREKREELFEEGEISIPNYDALTAIEKREVLLEQMIADKKKAISENNGVFIANHYAAPVETMEVLEYVIANKENILKLVDEFNERAKAAKERIFKIYLEKHPKFKEDPEYEEAKDCDTLEFYMDIVCWDD